MDARDIYEAADLQEVGIFMGGFIFFIMLVPALNLVGLNVNRISERSSEIGIRKAVGATEGAILMQFLIESILLTIIGALVAVGLALITTTLVARFTPLEPDLNWQTFLLAIGMGAFAGIVFGLPANLHVEVIFRD